SLPVNEDDWRAARNILLRDGFQQDRLAGAAHPEANTLHRSVAVVPEEWRAGRLVSEQCFTRFQPFTNLFPVKNGGDVRLCPGPQRLAFSLGGGVIPEHVPDKETDQ